MIEYLKEVEVQGRRKEKSNYTIFPQLQQVWAREGEKALGLNQVQTFHYYMRQNVLITD